MSRATSTATPAMPPPAAKPMIPHDRIAKLAYEKWLKGGCKHGCDQQYWLEAESDLMKEMGRTGTPAPQPRR